MVEAEAVAAVAVRASLVANAGRVPDGCLLQLGVACWWVRRKLVETGNNIWSTSKVRSVIKIKC